MDALVGERGVKNGQKYAHVVYERSHMISKAIQSYSLVLPPKYCKYRESIKLWKCIFIQSMYIHKQKIRFYTVHMMQYSVDLFYSIFSGLFGVYHFMVLIKPH